MNKYFKYIKTIFIHKWYVFVECYKQGIIWQGITHDLSKFSLAEFIASSKYYNGDRNDMKYQYSWLHHIAHNKHHWEYWVDWNSQNGEYELIEIPIKYLKEMYADIVAASKAYNKGKFDTREPYEYFKKSKTFIMNKNSRKWIEGKLAELSNTINNK